MSLGDGRLCAQLWPLFVGSAVASTRRPSGDNGSFWQSSSKYSAIMEVPHYWTADQVGRLLDALAAHNRHQARTAVLIMWRTGLRVVEVLELEWRGPRLLGSSGDVARPEVEEPAGSHGALARCACMATWCSCSRTGHPAGPRGTRLWAWRCGRRCGTSLTASGGRTWTRNPQVLGSGALVPIPCGTVLPGGFDEAGRWRWQLAHMLLVAMAYSRRS